VAPNACPMRLSPNWHAARIPARYPSIIKLMCAAAGIPIVVSHGCAAEAHWRLRRRQRRRGPLRDPAASAEGTEFKVFEVECSKVLKLNVQSLEVRCSKVLKWDVQSLWSWSSKSLKLGVQGWGRGEFKPHLHAHGWRRRSHSRLYQRARWRLWRAPQPALPEAPIAATAASTVVPPTGPPASKMGGAGAPASRAMAAARCCAPLTPAQSRRRSAVRWAGGGSRWVSWPPCWDGQTH